MTDVAATREFIKSLPKTETHLHVEGALPWELLERKNPAKYSRQPDFRGECFRYESFEQFESILIDHALDWFDSPESYHEAAGLIFKKQVNNLEILTPEAIYLNFHISPLINNRNSAIIILN